MYNLNINGQNYIFTENQQWLDNDTFSVIATCDNKEYCIDYNATEIQNGEEEQIDWASPSLITRIDDGMVVFNGE